MGVLMENELNDEVMKIKALETQFSVLYKQYQETEKNYENAYKNWMSGKKNYVKMGSMTSTGGFVKSETTSNDVEQCLGLCSADNCGYATFSSDTKKCKIMDGDVVPTKGTSVDTGIIPDVLYYVLELQMYNISLIQLSENILSEFNKIEPKYESQVVEKNQKKEVLKETWNKLIVQREQIDKLVEEHNSLNENNKNQTLNTNQQNGAFKVWAFLAIILILMYLKQFTDVELSTTAIIIVISAITFIALSFNLSTIGGFFVWLVVLLLVVMLYPMFNV